MLGTWKNLQRQRGTLCGHLAEADLLGHIEWVFRNVVASANSAIYWLVICPRRCFDATMLYPITSRARTSGEVTVKEGVALELVNASCTWDGVCVIQSP